MPPPLYSQHVDGPARPAILQCIRCGRTGRVGFVLVDRYADGTEEWKCTARLACSLRVKYGNPAGRY